MTELLCYLPLGWSQRDRRQRVDLHRSRVTGRRPAAFGQLPLFNIADIQSFKRLLRSNSRTSRSFLNEANMGQLERLEKRQHTMFYTFTRRQ
ncbi:hypothetical protein [Burkholderia sp. GbtcB21]|uniref:hypothetical protein n=1 Tax=Burkholderia sp. GbtcB21 TaxID=2824766 RepID=UPI001C303211|nr:hypothetical protein [Burkholderia sp. GbtcB21]